MTLREFIAGGVNYVPYSARPWIKNIPGVAGLQRALISGFLSRRPFVHTINGGPAAGLRFEVTLPLDKAMWAGTYEPQFMSSLVEHIKPGDICYDVGGYRGYTSGAMALAGAAQVIVFEPLPENYTALRRLTELNPNLPITLKNLALGNADERAHFKMMTDLSMGKLAGSPFQPAAMQTADLTVALRKIDSMVAEFEIPPPHMIKIDVEGGELDVLKGALEVLRAARPKIFLEAHGREMEEACSGILSALGYKSERLDRKTLSQDSTRHLVCLP
jgi:FkbM family methyltransferase